MYALHIRWGVARDLPQIMAISDGSFVGGWTEDDFRKCLRQRNCIIMVAEQGEKVVGYVVYELNRTYIRLLNFAVAPSSRRQGVGTALLQKMRYKLCSHRREKLTVTVRESSDTALLFFRAGGLRAVAFERGAFETEAGIRLEYRPTLEEWEAEGMVPPVVNRLAAYGV